MADESWIHCWTDEDEMCDLIDTLDSYDGFMPNVPLYHHLFHHHDEPYVNGKLSEIHGRTKCQP